MTSTDLTISSPPTTTLVNLGLTIEQIQEMGKQYLAMTCTDSASRTECGKSRKVLVSTRTGLVKRSTELKQPLRDDMKRIDEAEELLVAALAPIEKHLDSEIKTYDNARKAEKEAKEAALRAENEARIAAAMAEATENARIAREAEEARLAAERAENARRKAELDAREAAIETERVKVEAAARAERERVEAAAKAERELADRMRAERDRVAAAAQAEIDRKNREAQAKIDSDRKALKDEQDRLDATRIAQERAEAARVAAAQAEAERLAREEAERVTNNSDPLRQFGSPMSCLSQPELDVEKLDWQSDGPIWVETAVPVDQELAGATYADAERLVAYMDAIDALPKPEMSTDAGVNEMYEIMVRIGNADALAHSFLSNSTGESP
jgi:hypothetical protein